MNYSRQCPSPVPSYYLHYECSYGHYHSYPAKYNSWNALLLGVKQSINRHRNDPSRWMRPYLVSNYPLTHDEEFELVREMLWAF